jgi:hypothetical protein
MKFDTTKIDIMRMLSAFHYVVLHICELLVAAIEEDHRLAGLLPQDVIKEVVENFTKAHDFSNVLRDRSDSTKVHHPKKRQMICYDRERAANSVHSDWYCPSPRYNDRQFERTFHVKRNMVGILIRNLANFDSLWTQTIDCCGIH